ncbi:MAG TPA: hypothetical protein VLM38_18345 [Blastocatellia bacterium]|nr:hypothetical protein [Blastocatellia bacterium]
MTETREIEVGDAGKSADEAGARGRRRQVLVALLCLGLSAVAVVPFFFMGQSESGGGALELRMPTTHDMFLHFDQMKSFYNGLAAGEVYPRWEEDTNRGFGAPTTSYYPPGIYYLTAACFAFARDWLRALVGAHLVMMIASAAALYFYARETMGRAAATASMATYIFLPYHLADLYQRGAIAELLGFIWMPMMLRFADRLLKAPRAEDPARAATSGSSLLGVAGLALSYGAFVWSHPPTAFQFTLGFGVYVLVLSLIGRQWKRLPVIVLALALGIGVSAVYLGPAAIEQNLIHKEFIFETWPYHKTYIFVHDLYSADFYGGFFKLLDWIWITGTIVIAGAALVLLWFKRQTLADLPVLHRRVAAWVIVGGLASFMMTKASMPVGKLIPKIEIGVFTWRMLSITTLVVALLAGAFVEAAIAARREGRRSERLLFTSIFLVVLVGSVIFSAIAVIRPVASYSTFEPEQEHINYATIPITAPADPEELPVDTPPAELADENGGVSVEEWKPEHRVVRAELTSDDQLLLRTFNFPGWTATVDGREVPIRTAEELGDMEIDLVAGSHTVELDFLDTPARRYGRVTTLVSLGLVFGLGCAGFARRFKRGRVSASA